MIVHVIKPTPPHKSHPCAPNQKEERIDMNATADFKNYYREYNSIKKYRQNPTGTVGLGIVTFLGVILFIYRFWELFLGLKCEWAIFNRIVVPPIQFLYYLVIILESPDKNVNGLCLFGRIAVPIASFAYCLLMIFMSVQHKSPLETAFYLLLTIVQVAVMLPDTLPGVWLFRPFLKRPDGEVEEERFEIVRKYEVPKITHDFNE